MLPRFKFQVLDDSEGIYRAFPQDSGHTIVGRLYPDWEDIADGSPLLVETMQGNVFSGNFRRAALLNKAEFHLDKLDGSAPDRLLVEFVRSVWEPKAYISSEAFMVQPAEIAA